MKKLIKYFEKTSALKLWFLAHIMLWVPTIVVMFICYIGEKLLGFQDLYDSLFISCPVILFQVISVIYLIATGIKYYVNNRGYYGMFYVILIVFFTGIYNYFVYIIVSLWFYVEIMGKY